VLLSDLVIGLDKPHSRNSAKADDHLRAYESHLFAQIIYARVLLCGERIAVFGRTAFKDVSNVDVLALDINGVKESVKKLTGSADKGSSRKILLLARCLTDEHQVSVSVARTENAIRSRLAKGAFIALAALRLKSLPSCLYIIHNLNLRVVHIIIISIGGGFVKYFI
jgi:hypothetical protein